jgi:hypothetical protein
MAPPKVDTYTGEDYTCGSDENDMGARLILRFDITADVKFLGCTDVVEVHHVE